MPFAEDSIGLVTPSLFAYTENFRLHCGRQLPGFELVYETYGQLNEKRDNALLICHALSGTHHAAGYHSEKDARPGWWDSIIGPGKPIDTNRFFVVCPNNLGGCHGSTGPVSINPKTKTPWAAGFPLVTVVDWVRSRRLLREHLGIAHWCAIVGASLGGMQALQWAIEYPEEINVAIIIAAAPRLSAQNIAFNEIARRAIISDSEYHKGDYQINQTRPHVGLMLARMLGHVTYLSDSVMHEKFGRSKKEEGSQFTFDPEFMVESYLNYQADKFAKIFDANTYLLMTRALDYYDPAAAFNNDLIACMRQTQCKFMIISFSSDWRFSPKQSEELVTAMLQAGKDVSYACIESEKGHDSFLLPSPVYHAMVGNFLRNQTEKLWNTTS